MASRERGRCGGAAPAEGVGRDPGSAAGEGVPLAGAPKDEAPSDLDSAMRRAALRLGHEQLVDARADFLDDAARRWRQVHRLLAFLQAVLRRVGGAATPELRRWLAWANAHCDALDPLSDLGLKDLQAYAAALRPPPDLGSPDPEEQLWRDMGWLDTLLDEAPDGRPRAEAGRVTARCDPWPHRPGRASDGRRHGTAGDRDWPVTQRKEPEMSQPPETVRAAQYLRMSTDMQDCSIAYQVAHNQAYAEERGYQIVRDFTDEGVSGLGIERREALQSLIAQATGGTADFSVVLVYDISRWGRFQNPDESAYYEFICARAGIAIEYTSEPSLNEGTLTATLVKAIKRVMAADYSRELSLRMVAAKRSLVMRGLWSSGPAPYGYVRQLVNRQGDLGPALGYHERLRIQGYHAVLKPAPAEADVVRRIFRLYNRGWFATRIADELNAEGVVYRPGLPWSAPTLNYMLRNELYFGVMVYGRSRVILGKKAGPQPEAKQVRVEGFTDPLVSKATFGKAQRERARRLREWTPAELLDGLRKTLEREGKLSLPIIARSADCPSPGLYRKAFGSIEAAYGQIGYQLPVAQKARLAALQASRGWARPWSRPGPSDETLLDELRAALARHGRLTGAIIKRSSDLRSPGQYRRRFRGLAQAYALIGYVPSSRQVAGFRTNPWRGRRRDVPAAG